jgi:hypothetical protein
MRVAYDPMNTNRLNPLGVDDMIPISQAPGVWIEPQKDSSVELSLPFLWPHNWLDISNTNEFHHMGRLFFEIFAPLRSANGVNGAGINISTYIQAENVTVAGPTLALALQSGIISGPATAVANFARSVSNVPRIGPFARAVDVGARAVGVIASMFGYSNAPVLSDVQPVQPKSFHAFANTETSMPLDKLCVDPMNETTIDNSVAGGDSEDPLVISDLVQRVSYFGQTDWTDADAENTMLFSWTATPCLIHAASDGTGVMKWRMPASAWVSSLFRYWHGSMIYHIKVVKSRYHKGRLLVCWDPAPTVPVSGAETALFTKIIDLSSDQDEFEFAVPYKATQPWLRTNYKRDGFTVRGNCTPDVSTTNGCLAIYVQNRLTGPAVLPTVTVMVSVSAGPDMQFAVPLTNQVNATVLAVQSGTIDEGDHKLSEKLNLITVGETIASLRPLLHRATLGYSQTVGSKETATLTYVGAGLVVNSNIFPRMPPPLGFDNTQGISWAVKNLSSGSAPFNYSPNHPLNWILLPFVGYRGSTNIHANVLDTPDVPFICSFAATRSHENHITSAVAQARNRFSVSSSTNTTSSLSRLAASMQGDHTRRPWGHGGMSLTNPLTQSALSVNIPMYSQWKFQPAWPPYRDFVPSAADRNTGNRSYDNVRFDTSFIIRNTPDADTAWPVLDLYWSAGVDFQPVYFVGVPRMSIVALPTADDRWAPTPT